MLLRRYQQTAQRVKFGAACATTHVMPQLTTSPTSAASGALWRQKAASKGRLLPFTATNTLFHGVSLVQQRRLYGSAPRDGEDDETQQLPKSANSEAKWVQKARMVLEAKDLKSIGKVFTEFSEDYEASTEVRDVLAKTGAFLVQRAKVEDCDAVVFRDACVAVGNCAVALSHTAGMCNVARALRNGAGEHYEDRPVFRTVEVRALLADIGNKAVELKDGGTIVAASRAMHSLVRGEFFHTAESRDALAAMGKTAAELKHDDAIENSARTLKCFAYWGGKGFRELFGSEEVRDALVAMGRTAAELKLSGAMAETTKALCTFELKDENKALFCKIFGTKEVRDALVAMGKTAAKLKHRDAIESSGWALCWFSDCGGKRFSELFGTEDVRDALVAIGKVSAELKLSDAMGCTAQVMCTFELKDENKALFCKLFGTKEVRDALVAMGNTAAERLWGRIIKRTAEVMHRITSNDATQKLFGTAEVRDALVAMGSTAAKLTCSHLGLGHEDTMRKVVGGAIQSICGTITNLTCDDEGKKFFGTPKTRDALVAMGNRAAEDRCVPFAVTELISHLALNDANKKLFCNKKVLDILVKMAKDAANGKEGNAICMIGDAIINIVCDVESQQQLLGTAELRDALVAMGKRAVNLKHCDAVERTAFLLNRFLCSGDKNNEKLFSTSGVRDALLAMGSAAAELKHERGIQWTAEALCTITNNEKNEWLFVAESERDAIIAMGKAAVELKHGGAICKTANAICNITSNFHNKRLFAATKSVRDALVVMANAAAELKHTDGIRWTAAAVESTALETWSVAALERADKALEWVQKANASLETKCLVSISSVFTEFSEDYEVSKEVRDVLDKTGAFLVQRAKVKDCDAVLLRDACVAVGNCAVALSHAACIRRVARVLQESVIKRTKGKRGATTAKRMRAVFGTVEVAALLVGIGNKAAELKLGDTIDSTALAISRITRDDDTQELLRKEEVHDALRALVNAAGDHCGTSVQAEWVSSTINKLTYGNDVNKRNFGTDEVRDALVAMMKAAVELQHDGARLWTTSAIRNIMREDQNRKLFDTKEVQEALDASKDEEVEEEEEEDEEGEED